MTLKEIRRLFVEASGRYDLVVDLTDYANALTGIGADYFIRSGQRFLDMQLTNRQATGTVRALLEEGWYYYEFSAVRAILDVRVVYDEAAVNLERLPYRDFYTKYSDFEAVDTGMPRHWTVELTREVSPERAHLVSRDRVLVLPAPDQEAVLEIVVKQFSASLVRDRDTSWWSLVHPEILVSAAQYSLESMYRNRQGMADHLALIQPFLDNIDLDQAEEDSSGDMTMEDSW